MAMPGRTYAAIGDKYKYSFNGKENDNDFNEGAQDFDAREYDNRLGRFYSTDPHQGATIFSVFFFRTTASFTRFSSFIKSLIFW